MMLLTEQIQIKSGTSFGQLLSRLCHLSKNLYNLALYHLRQYFFRTGKRLGYYRLYLLLKDSEAYKALPAQTSQQILRTADNTFKSFMNANRDYHGHPEKYRKWPRIPKYKRKNGEFLLIFTAQQSRIREGKLYFPKKTELPPVQTRITERIH